MLSRCSRSFASPTLYRRYTPTRPLSTPGSATPKDERQQDSRTLKLPDSRLLGYVQYGDSNGNPLFFFHGLPSSRLECAEFDLIAKKHNIHLIGMDRPGMGLSTFQPNRKILDWPDDVTRLADHLELNSFRVMGSSGGGPYALVCAYVPMALRKPPHKTEVQISSFCSICFSIDLDRCILDRHLSAIVRRQVFSNRTSDVRLETVR